MTLPRYAIALALYAALGGMDVYAAELMGYIEKMG